jgi:hypothetical protein
MVSKVKSFVSDLFEENIFALYMQENILINHKPMVKWSISAKVWPPENLVDFAIKDKNILLFIGSVKHG